MEPVTGAYGKIPSRGDFVRRRLPSSFVEGWDDWLQQAIMQGREDLAERWRQLYLNGPIWRFVLSPQVLGETVAAGVMMPSIDSVQRDFPLTLVALFPTDTNPFLLALEEKWFLDLEDIGLACLEADYLLEGLDGELDGVAAPGQGVPPPTMRETESGYEQCGWTLRAERTLYETQLYPTLLNHCALQIWGPYSLWGTSGSDAVEPFFRVFRGMPSPAAFSSFLCDLAAPHLGPGEDVGQLLPDHDDVCPAASVSEDKA